MAINKLIANNPKTMAITEKKKGKKKPAKNSRGTLTGKKRGLTTRQKRFIEEYCATYNATRSAITAGYSKKTAKEQGCRLLTNVHIQAAVNKRMAELSMSAEEAIKRLGDMGRGSFEHFMDYDEQTQTLRIDLSKPGAREHMHLLRKIKQNDTIVKERSTKDRQVIDRTFEVELHDAKDALDKILKVHGRYIENLNVNLTAEKWDPEKGDPRDYVKQQLTGGK